MSIIQRNQRVRKWTVGAVLVFFILTQVLGGVFLYARPAAAQLVVADPVTGAQTTVKNIKDFLKILVVNAGTMALINAASRFMQKISYDLAVSLASGGGGQMPLFSTEGWGDYLASAGLDAAGEFIGSFGDMVGVNFCAPPNPRVGLALQLQLSQTYAEGLPPPTCEWSSIQSNWESFIAEVQTEDFLREAASQFQIGYGAGTDLDLAISTYVGAFNAERSASETAALTREEGQGFLPASELISGDIKTPAEVIRQTSQIQTEGPVEAEQLKWSLSGQALSAGAQGILTMMASTFVSTLLSKTMERIFSKGMYSLADLFPEGEDATSEEGTAWGGRRAAELAFADLLTPQIKESGAYDILSDFIVCPDKFKGTNNCVMDGRFEAAVRQAQTGEPLTVAAAIEGEYLDDKWALIPPSDLAANQDPLCYTRGFCYSNLVKLRKARIISIGWEIAAQSQTATSYVTLKEVVDRFYDCNAAGEADNEHPYCHLIDPNWILKAPAEQCRARVYGPLLQTTENSFRQETCVDSPTCLAEDDRGNCEGGWGYCTREKNIWRLDGDQCDAQYDTCKLLRRSDGKNVAYVTNTVDYGPPCNADDIGCRWYSDRQSKVGDDWLWQDALTGLGTAARRTDRIFFNKNIAQCDEPGCNEFLRTTSDTKLNLVSNSSFENFTDNSAYATDTFEDWPNNGEASNDTYFGRTAMRFVGPFSRDITLEEPKAGRTFVLSFYAKNVSDTEICNGIVSFEGLAEDLPSASAYERVTIVKTASGAGSTLNFRFGGAGNCLIDAVQLEEGTFASQYHEGWGRTGEALYLKTAPDYYSCYDYTSAGALDKTNDAEQCGNFAKACEEKDVGCEQFRPTNGDPSVPGVANYPDDYCPAECVGYQTFKQVATDFEQDKFPVYFIPTTGRTCSAADAGCDQFTSLENEAVANFSYVRRCEKPGAGSGSFYTWEGSDTTGYQLKTWNLKISNLAAAVGPSDPAGGRGPCTKLNPANPDLCADDEVTGVCTKDDTLANPDCREFYDSAGLKHYRLYSKTIVISDDCHPYRKTLSTVADCGTSGGRWNAVKSECAYNVYLPESRACGNEAVGCRAYRGNAGANTAVVLNDNFDAAVDASATGWDEADTPTISSESLVVGGKSLSFGAGETIDKSLSTSVRQGGLYTLSFWAKGASRLDIKFLGADSNDKVFSSATKSPTNLSFDWRYFSLGPVYVDWGVVGGGETLRISAVGGGTPAYIDNIILREVQSYIYVVKNSWNTPISCDRSFAIDTSITEAAACTTSGGSWSADRNECILSALLPQAQLGCASFYDRANQVHYLKSFSRLCSPDVAGCAKLLGTNNNAPTAAETYNTENDSDPSLSDEERLSDNVTIPADSFSYIVVDDAYECAAQNKGCAEFGSPTLDVAGNVKVGDDGKSQYSTVNLLANPMFYNSATGRILCQVGFLACEEYTTTDGGKLYFKNPGNRLCEWKDNVNLSGQNVSGWFKKQEKASDPLLPCDPANFNGGYYNIWKNGDARCSLPYVCQDDAGCACSVPVGGGTSGVTPTGVAGTTCTVSYNKRSCPYSGFVGECIPQADQCTKFVDPADTAEDPLGAAYYYINNDKINSGNCNGMASQASGCVLFNDTSNPQLDYNANATYWSSEAKVSDPGGLVAPIDGTREDFKLCVNGTITGSSLDTWDIPGSVCDTVADCPGPAPLAAGASGWRCSSTYSSDGNLVVTVTCPAGSPCTTTYKGQTSTFTPATAGAQQVIVQPNDSNRLVQVRRDRVCGEWLTCSGTNHTFDPQTGREKVLCEQIDVCNKYAKIGQATAQCTNILAAEEVETNRKLLSKELYVSRDVTFKGMDYSGDSIYNQYQAQNLRSVNVGTVENPVPALAFIEDGCFNAAGLLEDCGTRPDGFCASDVNDSSCGDNGKCYNHICVTNFRGDPFVPGTVKSFDATNRENISCRAYPEQSSPFPNSVVKNWTPLSKRPGFTGANICENGENCDCSYLKASYGSGAVTKYFDEEKDPLPLVCVGGKDAGKTCTDLPADCPGGTCNAPDREDAVLGWSGYCLERDTATSINGNSEQFACLTWYPMDQIPGMPDLFNNYPEAGFETAGFNYYCLQPDLYKTYNVNDGSYSCHDADEEGECDPGDRAACLNQVSCPDGFVAIIGACEEWGGACVGDVWDDCPYTCVPKFSYHTEGPSEGEPCFTDDINARAHPTKLASWEAPLNGLLGGSNNYLGDPIYDDCARYGAPYNAVNTGTTSSDYFVGCRVAAKVVSEIGGREENRAWTNRLWLNPAGTYYSISVPDDGRSGPEKEKLHFNYNSAVAPFGTINFDESNVALEGTEAVNFPMTVKMCREGAAGDAQWHWFLPETDPDLSCTTEPVPTSGENQARPYTLIETGKLAGAGGTCSSNSDCNVGVSCGVGAGAFQCYAACNTGADCSDGNCAAVPRDSSGEKYCPADLIGGVTGGQCTTERNGVWLGECGGAHGGDKCKTSADESYNTCMDQACAFTFFGLGFCVASGGSYNSPIHPIRSETVDLGLKAFHQLFARVYGLLEWKPELGRYASITYSGDLDKTDKDGTTPGPVGAQWPAPPQVWPITKCTGDQCVPLKVVNTTPVNGITVGGISGFGFTGTGATEPVNIVGYGGQYVATMQFFGTADPNAGPIRDVRVDWNDSTELGGTTNARYKNHLGVKEDGSSQCDNTDFSRSAGACVEDYFYFTHTYKCPDDGAGVDVCASDTDTNCYTTSCPEDINGAITGKGSCCVFKPRVQLKDNWGWCNGTCPGVPGPTSNGCYLEECRTDVAEGGKYQWTDFAGKVIVVPKD